MKKKFILIIISFFFSFRVVAADFWLPAQIVIMPDGSLTHNFPFPLDSASFDSALGSHGFGVWPSVTGSFNKFRRIIALDPKIKSLSPDKMVQGEDGILRLANNRGGYRVIEHKNWNIGLGITSGIFGSGAMLPAITLGVTGTYGKNVVASRFVRNIKMVKRLPAPKIPKNIRDLKKWKDDDSLSWTTSKNVAFAAGVGFGPISVGATLMGHSDFNMSITKLSRSDAPFDIAVTMEKIKGKGWNVNTSAMVAGISWGKMLDKAKSWTFLIDLDNKTKSDVTYFPAKGLGKWLKIKTKIAAGKIYQEILAGNLVAANIVANRKDWKRFGVKKVEETNTKTKSTSRNMGVSVPFLISASYSKGKSFAIANSKFLDADTIGQTLIGVYNKDSETSGWLSNNSKRTRMFSGNYQKVVPANPNSNKITQRRYSGSYKYVYIRNKVNGKKLKKELKYLERKIGYPNELKLKIPNKTDVGTLQIEMDVRLSNIATDSLIDTAQKMSKNQFVALGMKEAEIFFKGDWSYKDVCQRARLTCQRLKEVQTKKAMITAYDSLRAMKKYKAKLNYKKFVEAYAEFGKGFIRNRFTFKTILHLTRKAKDTARQPAVKLNFKIQGTALPPYEKELPIY